MHVKRSDLTWPDHVTVFPQRLTLQCLNVQKNQNDVAYVFWFAEPLLTGFGCVTATQEALETDQGQGERERAPLPKIDTSSWFTFGIDLKQQPSQLAKFLNQDDFKVDCNTTYSHQARRPLRPNILTTHHLAHRLRQWRTYIFFDVSR